MNSTSQILLFAPFFALAMLSCGTKTSAEIAASADDRTDSVGQVLTITYVKKPWYAWRGLVVGKMKESFPEYKAIPGLIEKYYSFTEDRKLFGGIYRWESEAAAKAWFNDRWFAATEEKYGVMGLVDYFRITTITTLGEPTATEGDYWCTLSWQPALPAKNTDGLVKILTLEQNGKAGLLLLWKDKKSATAYGGEADDVTFFDTPLLLNN